MFNGEFQSRFAGRYFGKYRGIVTKVQDDRLLGRLLVKVPTVLGPDEEIGWALPAPASGGGLNTGDFSPPEVGDRVWIEFEEGDPSRPIWQPGPWGIRNGSSMMPAHSQGAPDDTDYVARDYGVVPPSQFSGSYGNVRTVQVRSRGGFLELDETPGSERLQLSHRSGTRLEMTSDGSLQEVSVAGVRRQVSGDHRVEVQGGEYVRVAGVSSHSFDSERSESYGAPLSQSFADLNQSGKSFSGSWEGAVNTRAGGSWNVQVGGQASLMVGGAMSYMIRQNLQMTVIELAEIAASNSLGLPTGNAVLIQGYNGKTVLRSTDPTGLSSETSLELDGIPGVPSAILKATSASVGPELILDGTPGTGGITITGGIGAGQIQVSAVPGASNILLGGPGAVEPFVKGTQLSTLLTQILTGLLAHMHPTAAPGPPSTSIELAAQVPGWLAAIPNLLSLEVMGK